MGTQKKIRIIICLLLVILGFSLSKSAHLAPHNKVRGYIYDDYLGPIYLCLKYNKVPDKHSCWECYNPPLFPIAGYYFTKITAKWFFNGDLNKAMHNILSMQRLLYLLFLFAGYLLFSSITENFCKNRTNQVFFILIFAIMVFNPRLFIMSMALNNDLLVNTLMLFSAVIFINYLKKYSLNKIDWNLLFLGIILGLASLTKYTGFAFAAIVLFLMVCFSIYKYLKNRKESNIKYKIVEIGIVLSLVFLVSGWDYINNIKKYDRFFVGTKESSEVPSEPFFDTFKKNIKKDIEILNYNPFAIKSFIKLSQKKEYTKPFWEQDFYKHILISLPALFWDDLGGYTKKGGNIYHSYLYQDIPLIVRVAPFLFSLIVLFPIVIFGVWRAIKNKNFLIISILLLSSMLCALWFYNFFISSFNLVGIKAKYIIILLPFFLTIFLYGFNEITKLLNKNRAKLFTLKVNLLLSLMLIFCIAYDLFFADLL